MFTTDCLSGGRQATIRRNLTGFQKSSDWQWDS